MLSFAPRDGAARLSDAHRTLSLAPRDGAAWMDVQLDIGSGSKAMRHAAGSWQRQQGNGTLSRALHTGC
jgi:hypothetical protein